MPWAGASLALVEASVFALEKGVKALTGTLKSPACRQPLGSQR